MKKNYFLISLSLLVSLFIYVFYRTEKTLINEILISMISYKNYIELRKSIANALPLNKQLIFSLPEGLWVFCISLTSKFLFIKIGNREIDLLFAPLLFAIGLELFQLLHITNGFFDFWDIGVSVLFWAVANFLMKNNLPRQQFMHPINSRSILCLLSYLIVYLAHV